MNKPSSKEVGPAYAENDSRDDWKDGLCTGRFWTRIDCEGKVQFYLAVYHDGYSVPLCERHVVVRQKTIRKYKRRVKKRLAAFRVGRVPKRMERHPEWEDDRGWTK